jgi:hypothetical protein
MKKIISDKPVGVIIHIYMELSKENSMCSYLYLKQTKMSCFSFCLFFFYFYKIREQEGRTGLVERVGVGTSERGRVWRKRVGG